MFGFVSSRLPLACEPEGDVALSSGSSTTLREHSTRMFTKPDQLCSKATWVYSPSKMFRHSSRTSVSRRPSSFLITTCNESINCSNGSCGMPSWPWTRIRSLNTYIVPRSTLRFRPCSSEDSNKNEFRTLTISN